MFLVFFFSYRWRGLHITHFLWRERERVVYLYEKKIKRRDKNNILVGFRNGET